MAGCYEPVQGGEGVCLAHTYRPRTTSRGERVAFAAVCLAALFLACTITGAIVWAFR
jgi:hypothetical protein